MVQYEIKRLEELLANGTYILGGDSLKKTIRKVYGDFEKEEKWLNEMSAKGIKNDRLFLVSLCF